VPELPDWLQSYVDRGFRLIYWPRKEGEQLTWKGPREKNWPEKEYDLRQFDEDHDNIGVILGTEIKPGRYLVDIDFDSPEAIALSARFFPLTGVMWVRGERGHAFYTTPKPVVKRAFENVDGVTFLEMRGTKADGSYGHQTMIPPSIHPSGEKLELSSKIAHLEITHLENLEHSVILCAVTCLFLKNLGHRAFIHETRLQLAGFLLECGLSVEDTILIGESIANATHNNINDVPLTVRTTADKLQNGQPVQGTKQLIATLGNDDRAKQIVHRAQDWLGGNPFLVDHKDHILKDHQENIRRAIQKLDITLSFNAFAQSPQVHYNGYVGRLEDYVVDQIWLDIDQRFHFRPTKDFYHTVLANLVRKQTYHPVLDYLKTLKWDETPRLDTWLIDYAGAADSEYTRAVSSMVLIAAVRRVRQPGCKFDELLILESEQGQYKSSALRTLCPDESWFSDDLPLNVDSKVVIERTRGKWIIEAADLSGMRASQVEHLKAMLSRQVDGARLSYDRLLTEYPRQWIVIGTTNDHVYLKDSTGNRRFWPMQIKQFDIRGLKEARDQIWAEAVHREEAGESIRLDPSLYWLAELQQERRREEDPWEGVLDQFLDGKDRASWDDLWGVLKIPIDRRSNIDQKRITTIMDRFGFKRQAMRPVGGGKVMKMWVNKREKQERLEEE